MNLFLQFLQAGTPGAYVAPTGFYPSPGLNPADQYQRARIPIIYGQLQQQLYTNTELYNAYAAVINNLSSGSLVSFAALQLSQASGRPDDQVFQIFLALAAFESVGTWGPALLTVLQAMLVTSVQNQIADAKSAHAEPLPGATRAAFAGEPRKLHGLLYRNAVASPASSFANPVTACLAVALAKAEAKTKPKLKKTAPLFSPTAGLQFFFIRSRRRKCFYGGNDLKNHLRFYSFVRF